MRMRAFGVIAGTLVLVGSLSACSSDSQSDAETAMCSSIASVKEAANQVEALTPTSTVSEAQEAEKALDSALADLKESAKDLNQADLSALEAAGDDIQQAVVGVSGNDSLGEAATTVKASTTQLNTALAEIEKGVQCK